MPEESVLAMSGIEVALRMRERTPAARRGEERGWSYFDGPSGTQMLGDGIEAMANYARTGVSNRFGYSPAGDETESLIANARHELKELLGAHEYEVVFGQNMTSLAFSLSHALASDSARAGKDLLVTELEHFANVDPWSQALRVRGGTVRWLRVSPESLSIEPGDIERAAAAGNTALIAVTAASNAVGVKPDLDVIRGLARSLDAVFVVDGVHAVPHEAGQLDTLGPDVFLCSAYKFYGPHVGVALVRQGIAEALTARKVRPAPGIGPEKFETGTQSHEGIAGLGATIAGLGRLIGPATGASAKQALLEVGEYEKTLAATLVEGLRSIPGIQVVGHDGAGAFVATVAFTVAKMRPAEVASALRARGVFVTCGDFYASALANRLAVSEQGGWVRAGVAGYTTPQDVHRLLEALHELALPAHRNG